MRLSLWLVIGLAACGGGKDGGDGGGGTTATTAGDVVSVEVDAADGGTVEAFGATLDIPPGALAADTTITVSTAPVGATAPDAATVHSEVFDFGPDGTTFAPAATLALPFAGTPAAGEVAVVSWLDDATGAWVDLPTTVAGTEATAPVEHFTWFVVRFVVNGVDPGAQECSFTPCGGDPVGSWSLAGLCFDETGTNPFAGFCDDATFEVVANVSGSYEVNADGTWTSDITSTAHLHYVFPSACLIGGMSCSDLEDDSTTCTTQANGDCDCTTADEPTSEQDSGTWSASGDQFTSVDAQGYPSTSEFCVDGDVLHAHDLDDGTTVILTR